MSDRHVVLATHGLGKQFLGGIRHRSVFRAIRSLLSRERDTTIRMSLEAIEIELRSGETLGVVGQNGAGKTTLLKTIAGLYAPTLGSIERHGEIALLAGLGAGMVDELTVADNIGLYGAVCRIPRATIRQRFEHMLEWAELGTYRDAELRTLSTGMRTRLAFAIAMHIDSDLLCMDEAFSAGDKRFQARCDTYFRERKSSGRTILVATHNLDFVRDFCDRTLWLHGGKQMEFGPTDSVLPRYVEFCGQ
jgi:ABC-type polysaccharide/polyol phosphate transport system ATPase subunit